MNNIFIFIPSMEQSNNNREMAAVVRFLLTEKWKQEKKSKDTRLIILFPRRGEQFTTDDIRWLRNNAGKYKANILVFDLFSCFPKGSTKYIHWLYVARGPAFDPGKLQEWLDDWRRQDPQPCKPYLPDITSKLLKKTIFQQAGYSVNNSWQEIKFTNLVKNKKNLNIEDFIGHNSTPRLLCSKQLYDIYYGLLRVSNKYSQIEHLLNRPEEVLSKPPRQEDKKVMGKNYYVRQFVNACRDMAMCLRHPVPKPVRPEQNVILLIDDHPELLCEELGNIIKNFCPGYKLWVWKPSLQESTKNNKRLLLKHITKYKSLKSSKEIDTYKLDICDYFDNSKIQNDIPLSCLLSKTSFILVDILFEQSHGEEELGNAVIRGLMRLSHDLKPIDGTSSYLLPEFIAISRADDIDKIHRSLQAGAGGYLLKSRLLNLPVAIGRIRQPVIESVGTGHRNFRALYNLPAEVISLLKNTTIDGLDSSRGKPFLSGEITQQQKILAQLLRAMPKTDLHVHAGSLMKPEFLIIASLVMLVRYPGNSEKAKELQEASNVLFRSWGNKNATLYLNNALNVNSETDILKLKYMGTKNGIELLSETVKKHLSEQVVFGEDRANLISSYEEYNQFRSLLYETLGIRDYWGQTKVLNKITSLPDTVIFFFAYAFSCINKQGKTPVFHKPKHKIPDVLRIFILFLASRDSCTMESESYDLMNLFVDTNNSNNAWSRLHRFYYKDEEGTCSPKTENYQKIKVSLPASTSKSFTPLSNLTEDSVTSLEWLLATGTRSHDLKSYLEGCELSGAEHLGHPYLMCLYTQQTVFQFVQQGVLYAEIRAAISGYENREIGFSFSDAYNCLLKEFKNAQTYVFNAYNQSNGNHTQNWLWQGPFKLKNLFKPNSTELETHFPVKVGVTLTGKRHKPLRDMLREAAAAVVLQSWPNSDLKTASDFAKTQMKKCRLVGFDLAGQEEDFPPEKFSAEFEQLARLHIPITAHAGENAHVGYIASAILDLRASRLGHGLALPEDPQLIKRIREDKICVELCPVSNFQTSRFVNGRDTHGRRYLLRQLLKNGNSFCINTDNPIISYTNIIKEYFQAAWAYNNDKTKLSLWEALRIMRMGFVHAFMTMPERRAIMEMSDQLLFDLLSSPSVISLLRELNEE